MTMTRPLYSRRSILAGIGGISVLSSGAAWATPNNAGKGKLIIVILRGAMDGLGAVQRPLDKDLRKYRPDLVSDESLSIDEGFALHGSLVGLHELYRSGEASVLHAVSGPYRERSHFLAQDLLEAGVSTQLSSDGWLNRALQVSPRPLSAVSIGQVTPLILRGQAESSTWSPPILPEVSEDTITRLQDLYAQDTLLGPALVRAIEVDAIAGNAMGKGGRNVRDDVILKAAGRLISAEGGPDIAVASLTNWDTHANQAGALQRRLNGLDAGLMALKDSLDDVWKDTAIAVVTEFGRTVRQNGTRGTDHGTGGVAFVLGGTVKGGRVLGDWPGLAEDELYENRDLYPANDLRGLFKGLLQRQFGFEDKVLSNNVFPQSAGIRQF